MKKTLFGIFSGLLLTLGLMSCGEKLKTEEQVQAEITAGFEAGKAGIESIENAQCDADFEVRAAAELDRLKAEAEAAQTIQ